MGHAVATLVDTGTSIAISVTGNDKVVWDGTNTSDWNPGPTGNWRRQSNQTQTDYIDSDEVIFPNAPTSA